MDVVTSLSVQMGGIHWTENRVDTVGNDHEKHMSEKNYVYVQRNSKVILISKGIVKRLKYFHYC